MALFRRRSSGPSGGGNVVVSIPPLGQVEDDLLLMANVIGNPKAALEVSLEDVVIPAIERNFQAGGRPSWEPLTDSTLERWGDHETLILTGDLKDAVTDPSNWETRDDMVFMDHLPETVFYGETSERGTWAGNHPQDQRSFMTLLPDELEQIDGVFGGLLEAAADVGGFRGLLSGWGRKVRSKMSGISRRFF